LKKNVAHLINPREHNAGPNDPTEKLKLLFFQLQDNFSTRKKIRCVCLPLTHIVTISFWNKCKTIKVKQCAYSKMRANNCRHEYRIPKYKNCVISIKRHFLSVRDCVQLPVLVKRNQELSTVHSRQFALAWHRCQIGCLHSPSS